MQPKRMVWKRYVAIGCLTLLALVRAEAIGARMEGRTPAPSRILRLTQEVEGIRLYLLGWQWRAQPGGFPALAEAPSLIREGALGLWEQVRRWRAGTAVQRR